MKGYEKHVGLYKTFRPRGTWDICDDTNGGSGGKKYGSKALKGEAVSPFLWETGELELTVRSLEHERRNAPVTDFVDPDEFKSQKCEKTRKTEK